MKKIKYLLFGFCVWAVVLLPAFGGTIFSDSEQIHDGIDVVQMSENFADVFEKLDSINWNGQSISVAIEGLEKLNKDAHMAATDERFVLVWGDDIIASYPRATDGDWAEFGEVTTALAIKMREKDKVMADMDADQVFQVVVDGILRGIGAPGQYIANKSELQNVEDKILTSTGIEGRRDNRGNYRVLGVFRGSPADTAGVAEGDLITTINGVAVADMSESDIFGIMSGFNSGTLKLDLLTPAGDKYVTVRRATVVSADADVVFMKDDNGGVLDIVVNRISESAVAIVTEALNRHTDITGIILDLRTATGENERAAAKLAGLFVGAVPVMRVVQDANQELEVVPGNDAVIDVPVVVVVSNATRGTAEALAATIYENARGVLIGTPTGGVARIASNIDLKNGGVLELLNKSIKTGRGRILDGRGVFPIVCLSNIRSNAQQDAFFVNVANNDFYARDFNAEPDMDAGVVRAGCPVITNGADEDALALSVAVKILTDKTVYEHLLAD